MPFLISRTIPQLRPGLGYSLSHWLRFLLVVWRLPSSAFSFSWWTTPEATCLFCLIPSPSWLATGKSLPLLFLVVRDNCREALFLLFPGMVGLSGLLFLLAILPLKYHTVLLAKLASHNWKISQDSFRLVLNCDMYKYIVDNASWRDIYCWGPRLGD